MRILPAIKGAVFLPGDDLAKAIAQIEARLLEAGAFAATLSPLNAVCFGRLQCFRQSGWVEIKYEVQPLNSWSIAVVLGGACFLFLPFGGKSPSIDAIPVVAGLLSIPFVWVYALTWYTFPRLLRGAR